MLSQWWTAECVGLCLAHVLSHQSLQFMNGEYRIQLIRVFDSNIDFIHDHSSIAINYICIHARGVGGGRSVVDQQLDTEQSDTIRSIFKR